MIFGGKGVDADGKEGLKEDLLLLEMDGGPSTIKVSSLDIKGLKPAPRMNAMFQVRLQILQQASYTWIHDTDQMAGSCLLRCMLSGDSADNMPNIPCILCAVLRSSNAVIPQPLDHALSYSSVVV